MKRIETRQTGQRLLTLAGKMEQSHESPTLLNTLLAFANLPNVNLRTIIDGLADSAYEDKTLLAEEFLEEFRNLDGSKMLVVKFIEKLQPPTVEEENEELQQQALAELRDFICRYSTSAITLHAWIKQQQKAYPEVNFEKLFNDDITDLLAWEIEKTATVIVREKYQKLFGGGEKKDSERSEEEKKKNKRFILNFFVHRVIQLDNGNFKINEEALEKLIEFINEQKYPLEQLYLLLYKEIKEMRHMIDEPAEIRASTKTAIAAIGLLENNPLFHGGFDYDELFEKRIRPIILKVREKKLEEKKRLRIVDITDITPEGLAETLIPKRAVTPLLEKLAIAETEEEFVYQLRKNFNYQEQNGNDHDSRIARLSDEEILQILSEQLKEAKAQIEYMIEQGLRRRPKEDPIHKDCRFIPEVLNCENIRDLIRWTTSPETFIEENPKRFGYPYKVIRFQCRRMLEMLLLYRKYAFREDVKAREENRNILEEQLVGDLKIKNSQEREISFRVRVTIDPVTHQLAELPEYEVIHDPAALKINPHNVYTDYKPGPRGEEAGDGTWYRYYPVESKTFYEVDMEIPVGKKGERKKGKALIYTGDGDYVHCKSIRSYLSSILRGKKPSDLLRWTLVTDDKAMSDALRHYLYENYATGGNFEVIRDSEEERMISDKKNTIRTKKSDKFAKERVYSGSLYATIPLKNGNDTYEHGHVGFETQIQKKDSMLIAHSDHTVTSHSRAYTPEREFRNIFQYLFPPELYGQRFADYQLQGFMGKETA